MESNLPRILKNRAYIHLWTSRLLSTTGTLTLSVTLGWQVYAIARQTRDIPHSSLLVGMVGLAQFLPLFALTLFAGEAVDRYDRRKILMGCTGAQATLAGVLFAVSMMPSSALWMIFLLSSCFGMVRSFAQPGFSALGPMLVPREILPKAIVWNQFAVEGGMIMGPWLGGILSAASVTLSYSAICIVFACSFLSIFTIRGANTKPDHKGGKRLTMIKEGLHYVWTNKLVFGAISLDLFAVLLGGVTALLPVFARDVLHVGAEGFGLLRSGPAIGGGLCAIMLARHPVERNAGRWMLGAVGVFGLGTIVFGLSKIMALSFVALIVLGAADVISVFVRQSLVQIVTPDHMRGRVSAVSSLFISASNELGEFESGVAARILGPIGSAVFGGIGSIVVTGLWAKMFPALRKADRLHTMNM